MSVLRAIESKLESLFEGVFGRAFRHERAAGRARPEARQGDGRPPERLRLARLRPERVHRLPLAADREQFSSYERQLCAELSDYLAEHARRENYALLTSPQVQLDTDDDLDVGVFGIATRLVQTSGGQAVPAETGRTR